VANALRCLLPSAKAEAERTCTRRLCHVTLRRAPSRGRGPSALAQSPGRVGVRHHQERNDIAYDGDGRPQWH
jgi:hypothetical protein